MTISLSSLAPSGGGGGSGLYKIVALNTGRITSGITGTILTDTADTGQYIKLTHLFSTTAATEEGVTFTIDGVDIISGKRLAGRTPDASAEGTAYAVAPTYGSTNILNSVQILQEINCTTFTITKDVGSTTNHIDYAYQILEAL
jgi:hypothetical protein